MSKYQALIDSLVYAKFTGGTGITASVADLDSLLADLERAEKALKNMCLSLDLAEDGCKVPTFSAGYENGHGIEVGSLIEQARDEAKAALSQLKGVQ